MRRAHLFPAAMLLALAVVPLMAPMAGNASDLDTVHVTASRTGPLTNALPVGAVVLTAEDIRRMPVRSLADVLDSVSGVRASRLYGLGDSASTIDLMGFGATATQNTLVLLNGRRLNDIDMASVDFSAIPLAAIERIEILPGSGAVLYGNGASGGAINIITRERYDDSLGMEVGGGSFNTRSGNLWGALGDDQTSALLSLWALNSDGYRDNNALRQRNAFGDLRHRGERVTSYLSVQADREEMGLPGTRLIDPGAGINEFRDDPRGAQTPDDHAQQEGVAAMPGLMIELGEQMAFHLDTGVRRKYQKAFFEQFDFYSETRLTGYSVTPRLTGRASTGPVAHQWTLGWDLYRSEYDTRSADSPANFPAPGTRRTGEQRQQAWYGFLTSALSEHWVVTAGARSEKVEQDFGLASGQEDSRDDRLEYYEGGIAWQPRDNFSLFANAARTARVATVDESIFLVSGNVEPLAPQTGEVYTGGLRWQEGRQRSSLTYWHARFDNEIAFDPATFTNINRDDRTRRQGYTLNSRWRLDDGLWMTFNATLQSAEFAEGPFRNRQIPEVPRRSGYLQLDWDATDWLTFSAAQRYVGSRFYTNDEANAAGRQQSYRWTDLSARARYRQFYVQAAAHNLQDRRVSDTGLYDDVNDSFVVYPLPGRYYLVSLGAEF
ncbi:MAG: ligand-gated channel [Alcanivorax sp.]|nr:ligand-gated channel [Alcanivorax sp.]